jgi:uncharacterized membrane protein
MPHILAVITIVVVGSMVGVEIAVAVIVNPIADRLPDDQGLMVRSSAAGRLGRVMPFWYIASIVLATLWLTLVWGLAPAPTIAVAAALLVVSVAMSITLLVPINSRVARWSAGEAPPDWREQVGRWDRFHYIRVAIIVTAFALLAVAGIA